MFTLVNLWELSQKTLFDGIVIPDGWDREVLVNTIFDVCGEYEPIILNPDLMKAKINTFFKRNYDLMERLFVYRTLDYNPLDTYRQERTKDEDNKRENTFKGNDGTENKLSAYDSDSYQPNSQSRTDRTSTNTDTDLEHLKEIIKGNLGNVQARLLKQDSDYWLEYNMYDIIADKFFFALCIQTI